MKVMAGKLTVGDLVVTATARFAESGTTDEVIVEAKARDAAATQPVITSAYTWKAPANTTPDSQVAYEVVRYAIPVNEGRVKLAPSKVAPNPATVIFVCATNQPR